MSNNLLTKYIEERNIKGVAFDIDNTLTQTDTYYLDAWKSAAANVHKLKKFEKDEEEFSNEFMETLKDRYYARKMKPILILPEVIAGLKQYLGYMDDDIEKEIHNLLDDFYLKSPPILPSAINVLADLKSESIPFVFCSHAQEEWTRIKVREFEKELGFDIKYLAIDIETEKDHNSWKEALRMIDISEDNGVVVGDNWRSDILAGISAGIKNLIWVDSAKEGVPSDHDFSGIDLLTISSISDLLSSEKL